MADRFFGPAPGEVFHDRLGLHELLPGLVGATGQVQQFSQPVMRECFSERECGDGGGLADSQAASDWRRCCSASSTRPITVSSSARSWWDEPSW